MFIDREEFLEFLEDQSDECGEDLVELLDVDESTPFLVETVFLAGWNRELDGRPNTKGLNDYEAYTILADEDDPHRGLAVQIQIGYVDDDHEDEIFLTLTPDAKHSGHYGLQILRNDNLIYERTAEQDPATEWQINAMAEDGLYTTEDGQLAFHGEATNI